jgi:four helix bundle protein
MPGGFDASLHGMREMYGLGTRWRRKPYYSLSDADMENTETQVWLDFSLACKYINQTVYATLISKSEEVGQMIHHMMANPEHYINKSEKNKT